MTNPTSPLSVVQISDPHLFAQPDGKLLGLVTQASFDATLAHLLANIAKIDYLFLTGDIVQDGQPGGYLRLIEKLEALGIITYCLPGNHDEAKWMAQHFNTAHVKFVPHMVLGNWQFFMLDTNIPNSASGRFKPAEIIQMTKRLDAPLHTAICMHHHPLKVGSEWLDTMVIDNANSLFDVIDGKQVKLMICGHVHQATRLEHNGIPLYTAPSTCIQFKPHSRTFALDELPPGYRHWLFHADGQYQTSLHRIEKIPDGIEFRSSGY